MSEENEKSERVEGSCLQINSFEVGARGNFLSVGLEGDIAISNDTEPVAVSRRQGNRQQSNRGSQVNRIFQRPF